MSNFTKNLQQFSQKNGWPAIIGVSVIISGCSGGQEAFVAPITPPGPSFSELETSFSGLDDQLADGSFSEGLTPVDLIPANGGITYAGFAESSIQLSNGNSETTYSEVEIAANFVSTSVDARIFNFTGETVGDIGGELNGSGDIELIGDVLAQFAFDVDGTLDVAGQSGDVSAEIDGQFFGDSGPDAILGALDGSIDYNGTVFANGFQSDFVAN